MKIIVCGSGQVGSGIAKQLAHEENSVTVIDSSPEQIQEINDYSDVSAVVGFPAHPSSLEEVGAADAEMIIAVTTSDEVNMVICQVAHSLFNIPIKIARIRHQNYMMPIWKDLYRNDHLPIDHIISPEKEVANTIVNRLHVPGAMDSISFADGRLKVIEVRCMDTCPMLGQTLAKIHMHSKGLKMSIIGIVRNGHLIVPDPSEKLHHGDELFFVCDADNIEKVMILFGHDEQEARNVLIIGGGNIGLYIAQSLEDEWHEISAKIIELDRERAEFIASKLSDTTVINGTSLDREILMEANIQSVETVIAVTNDDEVNILSSLLCKRFGTKSAFALINKEKSYGPLISHLGIDVTVNPREITVSGILQHTRRGKVIAAHSICGGMAEIIETEAGQKSFIVGKTISDLELPHGAQISAVYRDEEVIIPDENFIIAENDRMLVITQTKQVGKVDKIFSARQDYF